MNDKQLKELNEEQKQKLPAHLQLRLGYLLQQKDDKEGIELKEDDKKETPRDLMRHAYKIRKHEEKEQRDGLSD